MSDLLPPLVIAALALAVAGSLVGAPLVAARRRARLRRQPFPSAWRDILRRRVPIFGRLPADLQLRLKKHVQVFVAEKPFVGCGGLAITDEIRVTIAAQACLLALGRRDAVFPGLRQILVYPGAFVVDRLRTDPFGVLRDERRVLSGESWTLGQVVLSWEDVVDGAAVDDDGRNVVIHEFAHQLDQEKGHANGAPLLGDRDRYRAWSSALGEAYDRLRQAAVDGQPSRFSHYGATDPAEFFAVVCEVFFEQPGPMADEHPALYRELVRYFRLDPLGWQSRA